MILADEPAAEEKKDEAAETEEKKDDEAGELTQRRDKI